MLLGPNVCTLYVAGWAVEYGLVRQRLLWPLFSHSDWQTWLWKEAYFSHIVGFLPQSLANDAENYGCFYVFSDLISGVFANLASAQHKLWIRQQRRFSFIENNDSWSLCAEGKSVFMAGSVLGNRDKTVRFCWFQSSTFKLWRWPFFLHFYVVSEVQVEW